MGATMLESLDEAMAREGYYRNPQTGGRLTCSDYNYVEDDSGIHYVNTLEDAGSLPTSKVVCKVCLRIVAHDWKNIGKEYRVDPVDMAPLVTCKKCCEKEKSKKTVSTYHNRRKLKTRRK